MRVLSCKAVKVGCQPHGISVQPCCIPALLIREKYHYVGCFSRFCHTLSVWLAAPNVPLSLATINEKLLRGSMLHTASLINPRLASNKPICSIYNYFKACVVVPLLLKNSTRAEHTPLLNRSICRLLNIG